MVYTSNLRPPLNSRTSKGMSIFKWVVIPSDHKSLLVLSYFLIHLEWIRLYQWLTNFSNISGCKRYYIIAFTPFIVACVVHRIMDLYSVVFSVYNVNWVATVCHRTWLLELWVSSDQKVSCNSHARYFSGKVSLFVHLLPSRAAAQRLN